MQEKLNSLGSLDLSKVFGCELVNRICNAMRNYPKSFGKKKSTGALSSHL